MSLCRRVARLIADDGDDGSDDESDGAFWDTLRFISAVFEPIYTLMRKTDSAAPMMGKFYKLMSELGGQLDELFEQGDWSKAPWCEYKEQISDAHEARWSYLHCDYMAAGYALDPNFISDDVNGFNGGEVFTGFSNTVARILHDDPDAQAEALSQYTDFRKRRAVFNNKPLWAAAKRMAAHEWWEMIAGGAGELRRVAMKVLSKTVSASACERNWSAFEAVQTPKRNRLNYKTLEDLVYVRLNLRLQQKHSDPKYKDKVAEWVESAEIAAESDAEVSDSPESDDEVVQQIEELEDVVEGDE